MGEASRDNLTEAVTKHLIADGMLDKTFTEAYLEHWTEIAGYCINELDRHMSEPEVEGEEIAQQVFLEFWEKLRAPLPKRYDPNKASVRTFLFMIARRRIISKLRTLNRNTYNGNANLIGTQSDNPSSDLLDQEKKELVNRSLDKLPSFEREIIKLYYYYNHSGADIAQITSKSEVNIRKRLSVARGMLFKLLQEKLYGDE